MNTPVRYDSENVIYSQLNPIEDVLNLISNLRSREFTQDLLKETHDITDSDLIHKSSEIISKYVEAVIGFADQGLSGDGKYSFLPLYYSLLNLVKIHFLVQGKLEVIMNNRHHGASYNSDDKGWNYLNDTICINKGGILSVMFKELNPSQKINRQIRLTIDDLYQSIPYTSAEYGLATKQDVKLFAHQVFKRKRDNGDFYLEFTPYHGSFPIQYRYDNMIPAYPGLSPAFINKKLTLRSDSVSTLDHLFPYEVLFSKIQRHLVSDYYLGPEEGWVSYTPYQNKDYVFNEEFSTLCAFFHLSSIVRYNPEKLSMLLDSRYAPIVMGLRKHGFYGMLKLYWGHFNKMCFGIRMV